jgi:hypothetical protein
MPNLCLMGHHDLDDPRGGDTVRQIHGPQNFHFS